MKTVKFVEAHFWKFAAQLVIGSKEEGEIQFTTPLGTQRYFIKKVAEAINNGRHTIICLKGRQLGISTIMLALDLYWVFMHRGIMGTLIAQDEITRDDFREKLKQYYESLPREWRQRIIKHDRNLFLFVNKSGFVYQIAGKRSANKLGRGKGITFMHATELGSWGNNEAGLASLKASLAEKNPHRLFVYESTANGPDMFQDMWDTAVNSVTQAAIFIPWWMNELYAVEETSNVFRTYFGKPVPQDQVIRKLEGQEVEWYRAVKRLYGYEMKAEQIAWFRWKLIEEFASDVDMMLQEFPPTEDYAFRLTGTPFYPSSALNDLLVVAKEKQFIPYKVEFGQTFEDTRIAPCDPRQANLRIYAEAIPDALRNGIYYVMGADPAYGSSEWKDASCLHIDRVYGDHIEQVCDFHSTACTTAQFAWVIASLAGWYGNVLLNLEINGPGQVVYQELDQLTRIAPSQKTDESRVLTNVMRNIRNYRYIKYNGGARTGNTMHWMSTPSNKDPMMSSHRDSIVRGIVDVASVELVKQMCKVVRDGDFVGVPESREHKDDRVIAAALSHVAWQHNLRVQLMQMNVTKAASAARHEDMIAKRTPGDQSAAMQYVLHKYLGGMAAQQKQRQKLARQRGR